MTLTCVHAAEAPGLNHLVHLSTCKGGKQLPAQQRQHKDVWRGIVLGTYWMYNVSRICLSRGTATW